MNKLFQLIPIPFTSNILGLSSAGEKFTLLILKLVLKNIGRIVQKFETCSIWIWIHLWLRSSFTEYANQFLGVFCPSL